MKDFTLGIFQFALVFLLIAEQQVETIKMKLCNKFSNLVSSPTTLGVVHKLRLQEEMGRQSKNVNFYKVESVNEGGQVVKISQKLVNVVCERISNSQSQILNMPDSSKDCLSEKNLIEEFTSYHRPFFLIPMYSVHRKNQVIL